MMLAGKLRRSRPTQSSIAALHCIFWTLKPAACDGLPDKILLLGGEVHLHPANAARVA
jgi:hypothetical protein